MDADKQESPDPFEEATLSVLRCDPIQVMRAYRENIGNPEEAWRAARAVTRETNPTASDQVIERRTLLALGARELIGNDDDTLGRCSPGGIPCWVDGPAAFFRLSAAARHLNMSIDELVSRIVNAWVLAACDVDGKPVEGVQAPAPLPERVKRGLGSKEDISEQPSSHYT